MYLNFLRNLLKDKSYVALAYMTGILPIKKYGKHSALNMFTEYSVMFPRQLAPYTGFTTEEVRNLCRLYGRNFESIRDWYDGYEISDVTIAMGGVDVTGLVYTEATGAISIAKVTGALMISAVATEE